MSTEIRCKLDPTKNGGRRYYIVEGMTFATMREAMDYTYRHLPRAEHP